MSLKTRKRKVAEPEIIVEPGDLVYVVVRETFQGELEAVGVYEHKEDAVAAFETARCIPLAEGKSFQLKAKLFEGRITRRAKK